MLSYSLALTLSNKYIQVTIRYLEPKILNAKVEVIIEFLFSRIKPQLSHKISWVKDAVWSLPSVYLIEGSPEYE